MKISTSKDDKLYNSAFYDVRNRWFGRLYMMLCVCTAVWFSSRLLFSSIRIVFAIAIRSKKFDIDPQRQPPIYAKKKSKYSRTLSTSNNSIFLEIPMWIQFLWNQKWFRYGEFSSHSCSLLMLPSIFTDNWCFVLNTDFIHYHFGIQPHTVV